MSSKEQEWVELTKDFAGKYPCANTSCGSAVSKLGNHCSAECKIEVLERQLEGARDLTDKFIKRTESILQALYEDGSEEGHSEFFYRMNDKEQCLHEGFLRKLKQLKEKGE